MIVAVLFAVLLVPAGLILCGMVQSFTPADRERLPWIVGSGLAGILLLATGLLGPGILGGLLLVAAVQIAIGIPHRQPIRK